MHVIASGQIGFLDQLVQLRVLRRQHLKTFLIFCTALLHYQAPQPADLSLDDHGCMVDHGKVFVIAITMESKEGMQMSLCNLTLTVLRGGTENASRLERSKDGGKVVLTQLLPPSLDRSKQDAFSVPPAQYCEC